MKKILFILLLVLSTTSITFCTQEKLEPGISVNFESIQSQEYEPVIEKGLSVGKNISIEGYLSLQNLMSLQSNTIMVNLFEETYYGRPRNPHYGGVGGDSGPRVDQGLSIAEIAEYYAGYEHNERFGDKKDYR